MSDAARALVLVVGSTRPFDVRLEAPDGQPEDLAGADRATVVVREYVGATVPLLQRQTAPGSPVNLTIDPVASKLTATLTGLEADALVAGDYVGSASVRFGDDDSWFECEPFLVRILPAVAAKV